MRPVMIAGASMTRFGKHPDRSIASLADEAVGGALDDAGVTADQVEMVLHGNAVAGIITGQEMVRGQAALRNTGLLGRPIVNVENACASSSTAFHLAWMAVGSGQVDVALAIGAEKMVHPDRQRAFNALATAVDLDEVAALRERIEAGGGPSADDTSRSFFMDLYAQTARRYMDASGATAEDFAEVAVKSHDNGALNPKAQFRKRVTVEEVLASREIVDPLTLMMCSAIGDGAAAIVLCSEDVADRLGVEQIQVLASVLNSGTGAVPTEVTALERAAERAYELASVGADDLDVVELHDAAAPAELTTYEELGLCAPGDGPKLLRSGDTRLGGRIPVNPSGGLLSKGHPIGATGCGQLVELADQLRGRCGDRQVEGARIALAENGGGYIGSDSAAMSITILARR